MINKRAMDKLEELTPISQLAMSFGFSAAIAELTVDADPAVIKFLDRCIEFGDRFVAQLDEAGIFD